jgi:hypothetical protein
MTKRGLVVAVAMLAVVVLLPSPASATPAWSIVPTSSPTGPARGILRSIACPTANDCFAVGSYPQGGNGMQRSLIERWNGTVWTRVSSPNPALQNVSSQNITLNGVACVSSTMCFAVGAWNGSSSLILRWNGTTWVNVTLTWDISGALNAVSCASATRCFAVGDVGVVWNGSSWTKDYLAAPSNYTAELEGISCASTTMCVAVGSYVGNDDGYRGFVERWNGVSWVVAKPAGAYALTSVSCPVTNRCFATEDGTAIWIWNGSTWARTADPVAPGAPAGNLFGIACPNKSTCMTVGEAYNSNSALSIYGDGTAWTVKPTPTVGRHPALLAVACPTTTRCIGVGRRTPGYSRNDDATIAEQWNGSTWALMAPPTGGSLSSWQGIDCSTATDCLAVGSYEGDYGIRPIALRMSGAASTLSTGKLPFGAIDATFNAVACSTSTNCVAVGNYRTSSATKTLVEKFDGTVWSIVPSPNRSGAPGSTLTGVACVSTTNCWAVGAGLGATGPDTTLVEHWNGLIWAIVNSPNVAGASTTTVNAVSCVASNDCWAVGSATGSTPPHSAYAMHWNGVAWSSVATPTPSVPVFDDLSSTGVACVTSSRCVAVGAYGTPNGQRPLAATWNGTNWALLAPALPSGSSADFAAVSCVSASDCVAVGRSYTIAGTTKTLVERWNGTAWSIVASPNQVGADQNRLAGVSCTDDNTCMADGSSMTSPFEYTLVERYA